MKTLDFDKYVGAGLSLIAIRSGSKRPISKWTEYQKRRATREELRRICASHQDLDLAIVGGQVSGNLTVLDFDEPGIVDTYLESVPNDLREKLPVLSTPSGGAHIYFRSPKVEGSKKLAMSADGHTLIETRGEGAYAVFTGTGRVQLRGPAVPEHIPSISSEEYDLLFATAAQFDQRTREQRKCHPVEVGRKLTQRQYRRIELDLSWAEILEPHGWRLHSEGNWTRPGKDTKDGASASVRKSENGEELLTVFSTNAGKLAPDGGHKTFSKITAYATLNCGNDLDRAMKQARMQGLLLCTNTVNTDLLDSSTHNDTASAWRFVDEYESEIRYIPEQKTVCHWDGKRWKYDPGETILKSKARDHFVALQQTAESGGAGDAAAIVELQKYAKRSLNAKSIASVLTLAKSDSRVVLPAKLINRHTDQLNLQNGTLCLKTGDLKPHNSADNIFQLANVAYDARATCDGWIRFLRLVFKDDDSLITHVQCLFGCAITGRATAQLLPILFGLGNNGKSTLTRVLECVLGDYATTVPSSLLVGDDHQHPTELAQLHGVRLALCGETPRDATLNEARTKHLTGGDSIACRRMREDYWTFDPTHMLCLTTNYLPRICGRDNGIWRRIHVIPFDVNLAEATKIQAGMAETLVKTEASGILNWLVAGASAYIQNGIGCPDVVSQQTDAYCRHYDCVANFIGDAYQVKQHPPLINELYDRYQADGGKLSRREFKCSLEKQPGIHIKRGNGGMEVRGLKRPPI